MRFLILLIIAGVGAYLTVPTQAAHEEAARTLLDARTPAPDLTQDISLDDVIGYVKGAAAGQGLRKLAPALKVQRRFGGP